MTLSLSSLKRVLLLTLLVALTLPAISETNAIGATSINIEDNEVDSDRDTNRVDSTSRAGRQRDRNRTKLPRKSPFILVPGDGGSQINAKLDKPDVVHYFCDRKTDSFFNMWLNLALLVPFVIDCWVDNMKLTYDNTTRRTLNAPGVELQIPGFGNTTTIEYVDPSQVSVTGYYNVIVNQMVAAGYQRGVNIRGAPYDFRKSPTELEEYYQNFTALVEETYKINNNEPVIVVCHSMGCMVMLYYLNHRDQAWKDTYVKSFVSLAGPWGGAVKAIKAFTSGDNLGVIVVQALTIRKDERTFPSLAYMMPSTEFWGPDEVLMFSGAKNYTAYNYEELFEDIDYMVGYNMWLDVKDLSHELTPPGVEVHCIHGVGIHTMEHLDYKEGKFPDHQPKIKFGDGDGTVNIRSLQGCLRWDGAQTQPVHYMNVTGIDHMSVMTDPNIIAYLKSIAIEE